MKIKVQMVLHDAFGGFGLTRVMYERLEERGVAWLSRCARYANDRWHLPYEDGDEIRRDPDLVEVVKELEVEFEETCSAIDDWEERGDIERRLLHGVRAVTVHVTIDVEDHDGREHVRVYGGLG